MQRARTTAYNKYTSDLIRNWSVVEFKFNNHRLSPPPLSYDPLVVNFYRPLYVKSPISKKIKNNIFEGITYRFYILFLFLFVFDFQNKPKNVYI